MLFVDHHQPERVQRGEHRRPRAHHHRDLAAPGAMPLIVPCARRKPAVLYGHAVAERSPEGLRHGRRQRDLRNEHQHAAPGRHHVPGEPQVHLGLAAAGHAVQQGDVEDPFRGQGGQGLERDALLRSRLDRRAALPRLRLRGASGRKRVAFDPAGIDRHQTALAKAGHRRRRHAFLAQPRRCDPARHGGKTVQGRALLRPESARRPGQQCIAARRRDADDPFRPESTAAFERRQGERRHGGGQRFAGPASVVVRHPQGEIDHVRRQIGLRIQRLQQIAQLHRHRRGDAAVRLRGIGNHAPCHHAPAERHAYATAHRRRRHAVRHPVAQRRQRGYRDRDRHEHGHQSSRRSERTRFMSSQTSRFRSGLRSRNAGWKVGISFAPRHA